jgi:hypothetical protein
MIKIERKDNTLVLTYSTDSPWIEHNVGETQTIRLAKGCFEFFKNDILSQENRGEDTDFPLGRLDGNMYFRIDGRKLGIKQDVYIHQNIQITEYFFVGIRSTSIFQEIAKVVSEDIYIGGENKDAIEYLEFSQLIKDLPNQYEINKYIEDRVSSVLVNYFDSASDFRGKYERYMNKKQSIKGEDLPEIFKESEIVKYETILEKLEGMLKDEKKYNEKQWQKEILQIVLLLYPKYIYAFEEAPITDSYKAKERRIDFLLVDSNGNVDIIEIKRPMGEKIITKTKYRDNYIPLKDLSGTVMQIEKYIFHLNKSGQSGEKRLTAKYQSKLPNDFKIKITNPGGMIIMGRDNDLSIEQKEDFEVVKRKYNNVIDIITYDDLLRRLKRIIEALQKK